MKKRNPGVLARTCISDPLHNAQREINVHVLKVLDGNKATNTLFYVRETSACRADGNKHGRSRDIFFALILRPRTRILGKPFYLF